MKSLKNEKGIALVMVLILSLIALAIVSTMLYMITQGTQMSGSFRFFRTAEEASLGGTEVATNFIGANVANAVNGAAFVTVAGLGVTAGGGGIMSPTACLRDKLMKTRASWTQCGGVDMTLDATRQPDLLFDLGNYRVFGKIVDTIEGNSDTGGIVTGGGQLGGVGVVAANSGFVSPPQVPYIYKVEVQAQDNANVRERSRLSVLYAY